MGNDQGSFALTAVGNVLTGSITGCDGTTEIFDGTVDGVAAAFKAKIEKPMPITLEFNLTDGDAVNSSNNKISPHLLLNVDDELLVMQEEIFGPLLPIIPYDNLSDVITKINNAERPLAIYLYSNDKARQ
jgi:acyl-CoA reductase-like NAD-dependent aldehyde dehydrogenase